MLFLRQWKLFNLVRADWVVESVVSDWERKWDWRSLQQPNHKGHDLSHVKEFGFSLEGTSSPLLPCPCLSLLTNYDNELQNPSQLSPLGSHLKLIRIGNEVEFINVVVLNVILETLFPFKLILQIRKLRFTE